MGQEARKVLIDVDRQLLRRIDHIAVDWDMFRKKAIVRLLEIAVRGGSAAASLSLQRGQTVKVRTGSGRPAPGTST